MPKKNSPKSKEAKTYNHTEEHPQRPDIGTEAQFKKRKPPATYRYDSSSSPALDWDENPTREQAEAEIAALTSHLAQLSQQLTELDKVTQYLKNTEALSTLNSVKQAIASQIQQANTSLKKLKAISQPFLNWTGKAERLSFDVPTLPLFVHERLSTRAIIETLKSHQTYEASMPLFELFNDPQWSITDQILRAYEHHDKWVNRMILGDSLVVMNSLLQYEGLGGQVQMIYIDPPYGVKFGSNFQPFVRKRDVKHNDDDDFTREPEMVQAYRDTWELGLHSYLSYLRDRLLLARELLTESGSVFVQISDENVHHVRGLMDEIFGSENFQAQINYRSMTPLGQKGMASVYDYLIWYVKDKNAYNYHALYVEKPLEEEPEYSFLDEGNGRFSKLKREQIFTLNPEQRVNVFKRSDLTSSGYTPSCTFSFNFEEQNFLPRSGKSWRTNSNGIEVLKQKHRLFSLGKSIYFKQFHADFPLMQLENSWHDTAAGFSDPKVYVVQTNNKIIERCLLMTTDPGDLVLDITCGSGTTAYVAEQWGRRWITCDVSRVPLALARQRLLTATFPWYELKDGNSPANGFIYKRKRNKKGEEIGGIVPHITLKSIANNEPPEEEILVDRPEVDNNIVRVCSPFTVEGTIPPPVDMGEEPETEAVEPDSTASFTDRMLEVLRKSPVLRLPNNKTVTFTNVRQPARTQTLSAEALVKPSDLGDVTLSDAVDEVIEQNQNLLPLSQKPVAFLFGPENGAIAERTVYAAAKEAKAKQYHHLYIIGFAIAANARQFVEHCHETMDIPSTYIQATPDLLMGDLLKNMRSSQIFSVCGLPEIKLHQKDGKYQVELLGLDVFDPITMEVDHQLGKNVPAWFLDTDYNGLCFHVNQAFFPRTSAWDSLKKALKGTYEDSVWEHLSGTISAPFDKGKHGQIAVKVIDDRGNELLVVKSL